MDDFAQLIKKSEETEDFFLHGIRLRGGGYIDLSMESMGDKGSLDRFNTELMNHDTLLQITEGHFRTETNGMVTWNRYRYVKISDIVELVFDENTKPRK
jgi:hypothetical protein